MTNINGHFGLATSPPDSSKVENLQFTGTDFDVTNAPQFKVSKPECGQTLIGISSYPNRDIGETPEYMVDGNVLTRTKETPSIAVKLQAYKESEINKNLSVL